MSGNHKTGLINPQNDKHLGLSIKTNLRLSKSIFEFIHDYLEMEKKSQSDIFFSRLQTSRPPEIDAAHERAAEAAQGVKAPNCPRGLFYANSYINLRRAPTPGPPAAAGARRRLQGMREMPASPLYR
ncbi:hypothetical protein EVAR_26710_1 [Eumeta japonica]|uniref:Uncharacterized protein n=1 Tax=Eumeta variegata TaxID=151549 RepID=A0A4C1ZS10_EUMVA|nr:hypothetical protein EVAR_26710_1 [Eumeta japonica]